MATGIKTGGRKAGTPNRRTAEVIERLAALGCDPIEGMARLAMDEKNSPELRGRMYAELGAYVFPKRKAVEYTDASSQRPFRELTDEELNRLVQNELERSSRNQPE